MNGYRYNFFYGVVFYILWGEVVVNRVAAKSQCECACVCEELNELSCVIESKTRYGEHSQYVLDECWMFASNACIHMSHNMRLAPNRGPAALCYLRHR